MSKPAALVDLGCRVYGCRVFQLRTLPRTLPAALRDAGHAKTEVRVSAVGDLGHFAAPPERRLAVEQLERSLARDAEHRVRAAAAVALADLGAREAARALLDATVDAHPRVRQMALLALAEVAAASEEVRARLRVACGDALPGLRFQALITTARLDPAALPTRARAALDDDDPQIRYIAVRLCEEAEVDLSASPELFDRLQEALADADASVRLAAALLLVRHGVDRAGDVIVQSLNARLAIQHADDELQAITQAGDARLMAALPGLRRRLGGWWLRRPFDWSARVALCQLGEADVIERLLRDLGSGNARVRTMALEAVARCKLERALPFVKQLVPVDEEESKSHQLAMDALAPVPTSEA